MISERWMPRGFPTLIVSYKGRGPEWFSEELPYTFDWMGRKRRADPGKMVGPPSYSGKTVAAGSTGLIAPNVEIKEPYEQLTVDGVTMEFQNTPGTESPAEMNTWFPRWKAFWAAENITATIHNIYTLRGAMVREAMHKKWFGSAALGQEKEPSAADAGVYAAE